MLPLDSPRWSELEHAYGVASDIPDLLRLLSQFPAESSYKSEPWFSLWSSLYHQGDIYSASFAAVPHVIEALAADPARASLSYFLLPASIEVQRVSSGAAIPPELEAAYYAALGRIPKLFLAASRPSWRQDLCTAALAAMAAATGNHQVAKLLLETEPDAIDEVVHWLQSR